MSQIEKSHFASEAVTEALGDRYEILSELGEGSYGTVYKAHDQALNRIVAVKSIRLDTSPEPSVREELNKRFLREAQVSAQLNHPNIVTIHDVISTPRASLIVMEFVEGVSLQSVLEPKKRLGLPEALHLLSQVADALDYAHEHKVIHRDVKPANIMITSSNEVRVTDFGIAKTETSSDLTLAGTLVGTPDYMSPEQARGNAVDGRSDLFSLGCILYQCLTGKKPFVGGSVTGVLLRIVSDDPVPPVDWTSIGLPGELDALMKKVLAKEPSERYASGAQLTEALRKLTSEGSKKNRETDVPQQPQSSRVADEVPSPKREKKNRTPSKQSSLIEALKEEERALSFCTEDPNAIQNLNLSPDEAYIVSRIDGHSKPRDILALSPLSDSETARTLLGLIEAKTIRFESAGTKSGIVKQPKPEKSQKTAPEEPAPVEPIDEATKARIKEIDHISDMARFQDHAQLLGVLRNADHEEIERAFQEKTARFDPKNFSQVSDPEFQDKLRRLIKLTHEAHTALLKRLKPAPSPEPESPTVPTEESIAVEEPPPKDDDPQGAEEIFLRAERAYESQDYWMTIELCRHAIDLYSLEAKYHHLLGLALLENSNWRKEAEESLRRAAELDPDNPEYLELLGSIYQEAGLSSRAKNRLDRAKQAQ
jgi:serine/threonine protein kinase